MDSNETLNDELAAFYETTVKDFLLEPHVPDGYEGPFFTSCPKGYTDARFKWMYVGQEGELEALGNAVEVRGIMKTHTDFNLAENYCHKGAPFWSFAHALDRQLNPEGPARSFIWTNISRIQKKGDTGRVPSELLDFWVNHQLLAKEIEILRPQFVVLAIGNDYDDLLEKEFPDLRKAPEVSKNRPVVRVSGMPVLAVKSYHPKFLRLQKLEDDAKRLVIEEVKELKLTG